MGFGNYLWNEILDHICNDGTFTPPTVYVGLSTADPTVDGSGVVEPSGNGYARVETSAADWNAASSQAKTNANAITFPAATGSWGTVAYVVLYDAASGGNFLGYGALDSSESISTDQIARFAAAALSIGKA